MTITIISLSFDGGLPFGVGSVKVECRRGSVRRLGEADSIPLHTSQAVRLDAAERADADGGDSRSVAPWAGAPPRAP